MFKPRDSGSDSGRFNGFLGRLRAEDVLWFGWLILQPIVPPARSDAAGAAGRPDLLAGMLDLASLLLAAACLVARSRSGIETGLMRGGDVAYAVGPLFGSVAFALDDIAEELQLPEAFALLPIGLAAAVAIGARFLVPPLGAEHRRALVTPFILATSAFFGAFLEGLSDIFDLRFPISAISAGRRWRPGWR